MLSGIDPAKLTAQLKLLGQQDKETLDKMVFFLKAVSGPLVLAHCCWHQAHVFVERVQSAVQFNTHSIEHAVQPVMEQHEFGSRRQVD